MYLTLEDFKRRFFGDGKHPSLSTLRRLADKGEIPNRRLGKRYYVDVVAFEADGDPILEKVMRDVARTS
ncbi:helix-turn-helix domain-containing protein [Flagellatimonas centrodinii]|uniref:helix-turn-helix domain-containing protein n=1 Tax=Flagellatimonas centrodinii TaxID=2806210 RepID=UPI001FEF8403|nr:helix-turn-helix domain-containing protein [Flagellatimonas centrodinii]ULQ45457.1 helix-turn-helix domain-containing protein [Flagellatimonas centrodinii]